MSSTYKRTKNRRISSNISLLVGNRLIRQCSSEQGRLLLPLNFRPETHACLPSYPKLVIASDQTTA